jgi:hypothetical protein
LIYANPFTATGAEYYSSFNRIEHVNKCEYNPNIPIHITFDFNYVPYNSATVWQVELNEGVYYCNCIDEIILKNPRNSDQDMCETFLARYKHKHKSSLFIYGDATGKAGSTISKEIKSHIAALEKYLQPMMSNISRRIPLSNPTNDSRREFINRIFENKLPLRIRISDSCKTIIDDFIYTKQDQINGGKDKHIVTDPETKEKYQKYGHTGDGAEYFLCQCFKSYFLK